MSKKIVAIGGGQNGCLNKNGTRDPYETRKIDQEIVNLTGKKNPNFLFLGHAQTEEEREETYFLTMQDIYGKIFGCECKILKRKELKENFQKAIEMVSWADIIYEGGGDTKSMMELWFETGFDKVLKESWEAEKVICGLSAGANCWFQSCSSDSLKIQLNDDKAPLINVDCLNFVNAFFTPHCDVKDENTDRLGHMKESLKDKDIVGIGISNCCAIEIVDDEYRLIRDDASAYGIEAYGVKCYWQGSEYVEEKIEDSGQFKKFKELLECDVLE